MRYSDIINEISKPETRLNVDQVLKAAGYRRIGNGMFGAVYEKPGMAYVLKVFTARDQGYLDFLALAKEHQNNPHFPKFFGKLVRVTPAYFAVRMERLSPFNPHQAGEYTYALFDYIQDGKDDGDLVDHPALKQACDLVRTKLLTHYHFDFKDESFMMRGDTVVITDPVIDLAARDQIRANPEPIDPPSPEQIAKKRAQSDELLKQLFADDPDGLLD